MTPSCKFEIRSKKKKKVKRDQIKNNDVIK